MSNIAARNRAIKAALVAAYGRDKISVRGGHGTAYGWVYVRVPRAASGDNSNLRTHVISTIKAAGIELDHHYPDDGTGERSDSILVEFV